MISTLQFPKVWQMRGSGGDFWIVRALDVRPDTRVVTCPPQLEAQQDRWLQDPVSQRSMLEMFESLGGALRTAGTRGGPSELTRHLKPVISSAFRRGTLMILPVPVFLSGGNATETEKRIESKPTPPPRPVPAVQKTWIEIELLDAKGKPVPNECYRIETPDGVFHNGTLDDKGRARITGIDPGECLICFPEMDGAEWAPLHRV